MQSNLAQGLDSFVAAARSAFGEDLVSVVLFGSAAEDKLRATSDVNVIVVLRSFDPAKSRALTEPLSLARAAIRLRAMFLLESEVRDAARLFAVKFADIRRRHRVMWGSDPFSSIEVDRRAAVDRVRQVLLNLVLRLRERLIEDGGREERLAYVIAEAAGPLRACAAEILELEGAGPIAPKEALERVAGRPLPKVSQAREEGALAPGEAVPVLLELIALAAAMKARAERLP
jgi:predicted nucleotidyltransferase